MKKYKTRGKKRRPEIHLGVLLITIRGWYNYLKSKWRVIIMWGILGGVIGGIYAWLSKPVYVADTTFVLEDDNSTGGLGQYANLASMVGIDLNGGKASSVFQGDNILELYKSRTMIENTLLTEITYNGQRELLIDRFIDFNDLKEKWSENLEMKDLNFPKFVPGKQTVYSRLQDSVLDLFVDDINKKYLNVMKPDKKLNIIKAEVRAKDEIFARFFNEQIVQNVNDFYLETKTKKSKAYVMLLQRKTDSVKAIMNGAISSIAASADATPNINSARMTLRVVPMQRSQFTAETNKAILAEMIKNLELAKLNLQKEAPLLQVLDRPRFPLAKKQLQIWKGFIYGSVILCVLSIIVLWFKKLGAELISEVETQI